MKTLVNRPLDRSVNRLVDRSVRWRHDHLQLALGRLLSLALVTAVITGPALAQPTSPEECAPTREIDPLRLLRQASLDARGRIPSVDELERVRAAEAPVAEVDAMLDAWLESDEHFAEVRRQHRKLLWGNLADIDRLINASYTLVARGNLWAAQNAGTRRFRGRNNLICLDQPQTRFDANGHPIPIEQIRAADCRDVGYGDGVCVREGYVEVRPFWDPSSTIRVCAFEAQSFRRLDGQPCSGNDGNRGCGCGPNLARCTTPAADDAMREALADEPARIFEEIIRARRPYHEAFSTRETFLDGRAAHFYAHLSDRNAQPTQNGMVGYLPNLSAPTDRPFADRSWEPVMRRRGHAGVLTTPGYLLRFNSHRARANHFYTTFLCNPFVPSAEGIPAEEDEPSPNLRERAGCADCHQVLEPAAAHWSRWRINATFGFFDDGAMSFSEPLGTCRCGGPGERGCSGYCNTYYVTGENSHADTYREYAGLPLAAIYLHEAERAAIDVGPAALVDEPLEQRQIGVCAVRTLGARLLGRPLGPSEAHWIEGHARAFEASGYDYVALEAAMLRDPKYRTIR
ncbi:MAG: hypothetical protein KF901_27000 [Myxococcales bacterium]|nr:hypothetical protein [Myxococcales bacterium]